MSEPEDALDRLARILHDNALNCGPHEPRYPSRSTGFVYRTGLDWKQTHRIDAERLWRAIAREMRDDVLALEPASR